MKNFFLLIILNLPGASFTYSQQREPDDVQRAAITSLIDRYSEAREKSDTVLLKNILTMDIDQLVSSGEWRTGIDAAVQGMVRSSRGNPGTRTLRVEKIRMFGAGVALADCRYDIENADGSIRRMWSSFLAIMEKGSWKIAAIRNMLPAAR